MAMIKDFNPRLVILLGIAAGVRDLIKIGEVVISDRLVAYEPAALEKRGSKSISTGRPDIPRIEHAIEQDIIHYFPDESVLASRFMAVGGKYPTPSTGQEDDFQQHVASAINVRTGTIASGEKLLRNPDFLHTLRRERHGKILVGEMEAVGVYTACRRFGLPWLVIRGISDFGDHLKSDKFHIFASQAVSVVAADFVTTRLNLDYADRVSHASSLQRKLPRAHLDSLLEQVSGLLHPASNAPQFDLRVSFSNTFDELSVENFVAQQQTPIAILQRDQWRRILIHAPGGSGKTAVMCNIAREAINQNKIVFFLDLKQHHLLSAIPDDFTVERIFNNFLIEGSYVAFQEAIEGNEKVFVLVDGLNEIYGSIGETILKHFDRVARDHVNVYVIVADRMNPHEEVRFVRGIVVPLAENEIQKLLPAGVEMPINDAERQLLSTPFFLDLQIKLWSNLKFGNMPIQVFARAEMFQQYFSEIAKVSSGERQEIAKAAFSAYDQQFGRVFPSEWWKKKLTAGIAKRLNSSGVTVAIPTQASEPARAMFRHQLLHDFLVGEFLAKSGKKVWKNAVLDAATFKTNSVESISFASELLGAMADEFLIEVYDWSYRSANQCVADLKRSTKTSPVSPDLLFAFAAKNAEKLYEPFEETVVGARRRLLETESTEAKTFLATNSLAQVFKIVENYQPVTPRFRAWKKLFLMPDDTILSETNLLLLDADPITGWTAANTYRRLRLSVQQNAQIRMLYFSALRDGKDVLRWRIIHLLGAFPISENIELLLKALFEDPYEWARYGAVRSLMEIASNVDDQIRPYILARLLGDLDTLDLPLVLREIRRTILVKDATTDWYTAVNELATKAAGMPSSKAERGAWIDLLDTISEKLDKPDER